MKDKIEIEIELEVEKETEGGRGRNWQMCCITLCLLPVMQEPQEINNLNFRYFGSRNDNVEGIAKFACEMLIFKKIFTNFCFLDFSL